jgi:diguanylate cyclase (GGDEF)-like protein/PAS domain S-box-containing protein
VENKKGYNVLTNIPIAYAIFKNISLSKDPIDFKVIYMNDILKNMFPEAEENNIFDMTLKEYLEKYVHPGEDFLVNLKQVHDTSETLEFYHYFKEVDKYIHFIVSKHNDENLVLFALDKSEKIKNELLEYELKNQHILLRNALDSIPDMVAIKSITGKYLIVNKAVDEYYSNQFNTIEGKTIDEVYPEKEAKIVKKLDNLTIKRRQSIRKKVKIYTDNDFVVTDLTRAPVYNKDNQLIGIISVGKDITKQEKARKELMKTKNELKELAEKYKNLAYHDELTQVYNRRKFYEHLKALTFSKNNILILTDLNNFKLVNDSKGHLYGDETLKDIAQYLVEMFEPYNGKVYRLGGDEFGIIYSHTNINVMEENIDSFNQFLNKYHQELSISYGKILINDERTMDKVNIDLEIKRVDRLLYEYKEKSKQ